MTNDAYLCFEHISKRFNTGTINEVSVFNDFNLTVGAGEFLSIVGSNGSGKTTLLNLLCGTFTADSGRIRLDGADITAQPEHRRAKRIGRVFQNPAKGACETLTIMENIALAENKLKPFGLDFAVSRKKAGEYRERLAGLRLGLEDKLDIRVGALSGGQRQALALLLSTMTPIDLLVLDEHTAALDPRSSETVMEITDSIVRDKKLTAVMVTHNLRFAVQYGSRLIMMDKGRCVIDSGEDGKERYTIDDLLKVFNEISIECGN